MERAATRVRCPVASEVSGEVSEVSAMRKIGQLQGQRARRPYSTSTEKRMGNPSKLVIPQ